LISIAGREPLAPPIMTTTEAITGPCGHQYVKRT
jgi:hypothetical protein